jgi:DNA-binding PadR family transcriptional regulator
METCCLDIYRLSAYTVYVTSEMRGPSFLVLTALADGPRHGYGVIQEVERLSEGRTRLRAGTLYAAFDRLSAEGLIELAREEVVDGRLRRYYRLTEPGKAVLSTESRRRMAISKEALRRLRLTGGAA